MKARNKTKKKARSGPQAGRLRKESCADSLPASPSRHEKPISLHPLEFEEALKGLLETKGRGRK